MTKIQNTKHYDLEDRTLKFAEMCRDFIDKLPKGISNAEYSRQLVRASGSVAANYIEANESLSRKDFTHRIKICRKESKESRLWLRLCSVGGNTSRVQEQEDLIREATEFIKIFTSIIEKSK